MKMERAGGIPEEYQEKARSSLERKKEIMKKGTKIEIK